MRDISKTVEALCKREVRIYLLHALNGELNLPPEAGKVILHVSALLAETEKRFRSERLTESARWRKENGLAYGGIPMGKKIVTKNGVKALVWDRKQLEYIAEIADRLPREGPANVAKDFWRRGIKDRHGRLWGKQRPRPKLQALAILEMLVRGKRPHRTPYQQFYRAARWFFRMKCKGLLPPPYGELALTMQEPKGFREEPKPKGWTRGGTARREQERADSKARHHAERLARWQKEKEARIRSRVHKPMLGPQPKEGVAEP